jgi:hypothetical protein
MDKQSEYEAELKLWNELFSVTPEATQKAVSGLIKKAAYIHSVCWELEETIKQTGAIKIHPQFPEIQKTVPAVKEYARMADSYSTITNRLNGILNKNTQDDDDDEMEDFE